MSDVRELKRRIKGVQNTQKITKGMKTMSIIRLQRAQNRTMAAKPYTSAIQEYIRNIDQENVYFSKGKTATPLYVIYTSDRGLCGAFNDTLLRTAESVIQKNKEDGYKLILIGTKAVVYFTRKGYEVYSKYSQLPSDPTISISNLVMNDCDKLFLEGKVGSVTLVYNHFLSKLNYSVTFQKLLPIQKRSRPEEKGYKLQFLYEPDLRTICDAVTRMYLESTVYQAFLDSSASEYAARLIAMGKATDNADEMIRTLTLDLNKTRQADITSEILEVVSGAEALRL